MELAQELAQELAPQLVSVASWIYLDRPHY